MKLTPRQKECYAIIQTYHEKHGSVPTQLFVANKMKSIGRKRVTQIFAELVALKLIKKVERKSVFTLSTP